MGARKLLIALILLATPVMGQVFNCSSFSSSGSCGVSLPGGGGQPFAVVGTQNGVTPVLSSGAVVIAPSGGTHYALSMMYQTAVNVQAFTTTFKFISNNQNISLVINNCGNNGSSGYGTCGSFGLANFSAGASCEGGFSQAFSGNAFPYNIFALMFDQYGEIPSGGGTFGYSNAQIYQQNQSPCNPSSGGLLASYTNKFSTSPVPMNSPATTQGTTTGDTYSATLSYDGSNLNLCMYDVTLAAGSCSSGTSGTGTYFQQSWSNVSIPSQVDGTTGYIGIVGSSGEASSGNLEVTGWTYTVNTATASPGSTATAAGAPTATNPSFSPAAGSYSGTQSVTITSSGSSNICYTLGASGATILPLANQVGGCGTGTLYSGPVSVASSQTLYATAGLNNTGLSSGVVQGAYTISSGTASTPTFSPVAGSYGPTQSVTISDSTSGASIYYCTTSPCTSGGTLVSGTVSVSSSETLYAYATASGYTQSSTGSAAYAINGAAATPTFSPVAGTYTGSHTVTASTSTSACSSYIYFDTNATPVTEQSSLAVATSETVYAYVHGCPGYSDSSISSAAYTINAVSYPAGSSGNGSSNASSQ